MGLDISFHSKAKFLAAEEPEDGELDYDAHAYVNPDFSERADGLKGGFYKVEGEGGSFRAGSYSGYNRWRGALAQLVGVTDRGVFEGRHPNCPFHDLINFSDCEGAIGPKTSAKLAAEFESWRERAQKFAATTGDPEWFMRIYDDFAEAFKTAANDGFVSFH